MPAEVIEEASYRDRFFIFKDRLHAGELLAEKLTKYAAKDDVILLAVPAGGVPVGSAIAKKLAIPMNVIVVRKIQVPWNTEAGFGALTWDGETVLNEPLVKRLGLTEKSINESIAKTQLVIQERLRRFGKDRPMPDLTDKTVILTDDGLASGFTMLAAVRSVKKRKPKKIVVAVPTASLGAIRFLAPEVDEIVCLNIRTGPVFAVADAYQNWYDLTDEDVTRTLEETQKHRMAR